MGIESGSSVYLQSKCLASYSISQVCETKPLDKARLGTQNKSVSEKNLE